MSRLGLLTILIAATVAPAQSGGTHTPPSTTNAPDTKVRTHRSVEQRRRLADQRGAEARAEHVHRPATALTPELAFAHLRNSAHRGALARAQQRAEKLLRSPRPRQIPDPQPSRRPAGAGRYLAAVLVCADGGHDVPKLLVQRPEDLLVIANPGPVMRRDEVHLLERTLAADRVPLCLVLTHADCATAGAHAERHPHLAATPEVRAVRTALQLLTLSPECTARRKSGAFQIVAGVIQADGSIKWVAPWTERPPLERSPETPETQSAPTPQVGHSTQGR